MSRIWYNLRVKKILAVSGGIDSMALLDMFYKKEPANILVAHFNHGTRDSADADEMFVKEKCAELMVPFESRKIMLGDGVSEEEAREKRYDFLYHVANKYNGIIYTAHHVDDLLESVVINLIRGTFWRGLAPFGNTKIQRPLVDLGIGKIDILRYASKNHLCFRQDPTNFEDDYLRNRVRRALGKLEQKTKNQLLELAKKQKVLREEIEKNLTDLSKQIIIKNSGDEIIFQRDFFKSSAGETMCENNINTQECEKKVNMLTCEILRTICLGRGISLTRPQIIDFLEAIREYKPGKKFNLPKDRMATISRDFVRL